MYGTIQKRIFFKIADSLWENGAKVSVEQTEQLLIVNCALCNEWTKHSIICSSLTPKAKQAEPFETSRRTSLSRSWKVSVSSLSQNWRSLSRLTHERNDKKKERKIPDYKYATGLQTSYMDLLFTYLLTYLLIYLLVEYSWYSVVRCAVCGLWEVGGFGGRRSASVSQLPSHSAAVTTVFRQPHPARLLMSSLRRSSAARSRSTSQSVLSLTAVF